MAEPEYLWEHDAYCDLFVAEADRLADVARASDPSVPVLTCPGWTLAKLVKHVGIAHAWAAANVRAGAADGPVPPQTLDLGLPDDPSGLPDWLAAGARRSAAVIKDAEPDAGAWTFGHAPEARFWSRRMLHETQLHRVDADLTLGNDPHGAPEAAVDAIDELFTILPGGQRFRPAEERPHGTGETLHIHTEGGAHAGEWTITLTPDGFTWERGHAKGDAALRGDAGDVMLVVHRRLPLDEALAAATVQAFGDRKIIDTWLALSAL